MEKGVHKKGGSFEPPEPPYNGPGMISIYNEVLLKSCLIFSVVATIFISIESSHPEPDSYMVEMGIYELYN